MEILEIPVAFIRWIIGKALGKQKSFMDYLDEDSMVNSCLGITALLLGILLYNLIKW